PSVKKHLHELFRKRIFHYGYINTDTYEFSKDDMILLLRILKRLTRYLEDKKSPERPIYTFMSSVWSQYYDEVSAKSVAEAFRTVLTPDLFISKAHIYEGDSNYADCKILPPNLLKQPPQEKNYNVYFYNLYSALKHISDLDKLRNEGIKTAALSVSVGLYGRWYLVDADSDGNVRNYTPGDTCFQSEIEQQMAGIATVCRNPKYGSILKSDEMSCSYVVDKKAEMTFVYDTPDTLRYKLCLTKRNVTGLQYGITAARLEYSDAFDHCGLGAFPLLTAVKNTLMFFKEEYDSPDAYEECLSTEIFAEEDEVTDMLSTSDEFYIKK
ncbi:hypothetical protein MTO96_044547, partial [Rhipicephalus appendiculatus]